MENSEKKKRNRNKSKEKNYILADMPGKITLLKNIPFQRELKGKAGSIINYPLTSNKFHPHLLKNRYPPDLCAAASILTSSNPKASINDKKDHYRYPIKTI